MPLRNQPSFNVSSLRSRSWTNAKKWLYGDEAEHLGFANFLLLTTASIYQGIVDYQAYSGGRNEVWMEIHSKLLRG
jgi:hypothetical protein